MIGENSLITTATAPSTSATPHAIHASHFGQIAPFRIVQPNV